MADVVLAMREAWNWARPSSKTMLSQYCQTLCMARRYPILAGLCTSEHSPNPARWADPTTQPPCSRMDIPMAFTAKKTEHTGPKHRRGTYWGPKRDAKLESHRLR